MLVVLLLILSISVPKSQQSENQLVPVINDLSVVARLINGISLQSDFMRSSQNLNAVVGELLGIGDSNAIPELLKVKVKDLMKDVDGILKDVKNISSYNRKPEAAISHALKLMKSVNVEEVRKAENIDLQALKANWSEAMKTDFYPLSQYHFHAAIDNLNRVLTTPLPDDEPGQQALSRVLQNFANQVGTIGSTFDKLQKLSEDNVLWTVIETKASFTPLLPIAKVAQEYTDNFLSVSELTQEIPSFQYSAPKMDGILKRSLGFDEKIWEILQSVSRADKITDKIWTVGLHNGINDLALIFEDLNGTWLQENIGAGNDTTMLITALEPLQNVSEHLKALETNWTKWRQDQSIGEITGSISRILKTRKIIRIEELMKNSTNTSICVRGMRDIPRKLKFDEFYNLLGYFDAQLKALKSAALEFITSPLAPKIDKFKSGLFTINQFPVGKAQHQEELDKVLNYTDIKNISELITKVSSDMKAVDFDIIRRVKDLWNDGFDVQTSLNKTKLLDAIECLNIEKFDYSGASAFSELETDVQALKDHRDAQGSMKVMGEAIDSLISTDKKLKQMVRRRRKRSPEAEKLLKLADSGKLARDLGNGVKVLREMSEVFEHQGEVLRVTKLDPAVDTIILKMPSMFGKWTVEGRKRLEKLVDEVNNLNKGVGKNRSLESIWKQFGAAQSVNGAPIESEILRTLVAEVLDKSVLPKVQSAAYYFKHFPPLQLNFVGQKRTFLEEASGLLDPITGFFKDFFTIHTNTPPTIDLSEYTPIIAGIGGSLLSIALIVGGAYGFWKFWSWKQWNRRERHLIYLGFRRPDEETLVEAMDSCAHRLSHGLVIQGHWINQYERIGDKYTTAMHIAVEHTDEVIFQFFLERGGDPWMESSDRENAMDVLSRIWRADDIRGDPNEKKLASKERILELLWENRETPKWRRPKQNLPVLLPSYYFSILLPPGQCQEFRSVFEKQICAPGAFRVDTTTHAVVEVDWRGVAHVDAKNMSYYFKVIFSPVVLVSMKWVELVMKVREKNFHKDYDCRVKKVKLNGKVYKNVDKLKEFARRRHMPVGVGIYLCLLSNDEELHNVMVNLGFKVVECLPKRDDYEEEDYREEDYSISYYQGFMRSFVVYDGTLSYEEEYKRRGYNKDCHEMSLNEFAEHLLEMKITGKDGGEKLWKERIAEEWKEYWRMQKIAKDKKMMEQKDREEKLKKAEKEKKEGDKKIAVKKTDK